VNKNLNEFNGNVKKQINNSKRIQRAGWIQGGHKQTVKWNKEEIYDMKGKFNKEID
jgi:hypothetical protein